MSDVKFTWDGAFEDKIRRAAAAALNDVAEFLLEESNKTVPIDESTLQRSGVVSEDPAKLEAAVSYDTPYAVRLHEHPEYKFQNQRRGKWLELTVREQEATIYAYIAEKVANAMKG